MTSTPGADGARARRIRLRTFLIAGAATCGTGLLLAACSAPGSGGGSGTVSSGSAGMPAAAPAHRAASGNSAAAKTAFGTESGQSGRAHVVLSAQDLIRTAYLTVRVPKGKSVTAQADAASGFVTAAGGYVSGEQDIVPPGDATPQVTLQLKIPSAQYDSVLPRLVILGKVLSRSEHTTDVTQQVADVGSRVASAQAAIRQLRALLGKAGSVSALLSVQDEINAQESNLEALLAQQRALAHETSYATVTLVLIGHHQVVPVHHKKAHVPGFLAGLKAGWHALALAVGWVLTALGSLLPFLIVAAVLAAIAIAARRRLSRRKQPPAADPPAAPAT